MQVQIISTIKAKPFLKWAGGKTQLLPTLDAHLPERFAYQDDVTYIEPFVGGGALLFYMLQKYPNISKAIINDKNPRLINAYISIKEHPWLLIENLRTLQKEYRSRASFESRQNYFLEIRNAFNSTNHSDIEDAAFMLFLNRTCFNGLYRENSKGLFNVPVGKYTNPTICDEELIITDSELLQNVTILNGDFSQVEQYIDGNTLIYFDPPYRPLSETSNFNSYTKDAFNDAEQERLCEFFKRITQLGCSALLSNSDGTAAKPSDTFLVDLYKDFFIEHVAAKRAINSNGAKRGSLTELLIRNYSTIKG